MPPPEELPPPLELLVPPAPDAAPLQAPAQWASWHVSSDLSADWHPGVRFLFVHALVQLVSLHWQLVSHDHSAEQAESTPPYSDGHMP